MKAAGCPLSRVRNPAAQNVNQARAGSEEKGTGGGLRWGAWVALRKKWWRWEVRACGSSPTVEIVEGEENREVQVSSEECSVISQTKGGDCGRSGVIETRSSAARTGLRCWLVRE